MSLAKSRCQVEADVDGGTRWFTRLRRILRQNKDLNAQNTP